MEDCLENWLSQNLQEEMEEEDQNIFNIEQEFLNEILNFPNSSQEIETPHHHDHFSTIQNQTASIELGGGATSPTNSTLSFDNETIIMHKSKTSFNSIMSIEECSYSPPPTTPCILSFDHDPKNNNNNSSKHDEDDSNSALRSKKRSGIEPTRVDQQTKMARTRSSPRTSDHIIAERKRREEVTKCIIALSATIPGLKKIDKAYVLREAVDYMKKLQERVKVLENQNQDHGRAESAIFTKNSESGCRSVESQLKVEARVVEKEVLIGIHCEKQKHIVLKILALIESIHLSITTSSVLPLGTSTLVITIVAQMEEKYRMTMDELVKSIREDLLEAHDDISNIIDPC